jgi:hypothetical protein
VSSIPMFVLISKKNVIDQVWTLHNHSQI